MRLALAVLLCAGLTAGSPAGPAAGSPAADCRRLNPRETLWFCNLEDTTVSFERVHSYGKRYHFLVMCHPTSPPLPCDLVPEEIAVSELEAVTITISRCHVDLPCLLRRFYGTGDSLKTISIRADIPPPVDVLAGLGQIESLTLEGFNYETTQKTVPVSTVYSLQNLKSFYMRKAHLTLPTEGFTRPSQLTELALSNGGLTYLPPGVFRGLQKLEKLDLSRNKFSNLAEDVLEGLSSLKEFKVSRSGLQRLGDLTRFTPSLKTLVADENQLQTAPVVAGLQHLETIDLGSNEITYLAPNAFADLPALTELKLESNQFSTLPATVFQNSNNIETLYLFNNQIEELPADVFKGLSRLVNLQLNGNRLRTLPPAVFQDCSSLETLLLFRNQLTHLPSEVFKPLTALEELYLGNNSLQELPDNLLEKQSKLTYLDLAVNSLRRVAPYALEGAQELKKVDLSYNKLTTVYNSNTEQGQSTPFDGLDNLQLLDLSHNQIRDTFPEGTTLARVADLSDNDGNTE